MVLCVVKETAAGLARDGVDMCGSLTFAVGRESSASSNLTNDLEPHVAAKDCSGYGCAHVRAREISVGICSQMSAPVFEGENCSYSPQPSQDPAQERRRIDLLSHSAFPLSLPG